MNSNVSNTSPRLLRVGEACDALRVGRTKFYELVTRGLIDVVKIDHATRVDAASIDRFIASLRSDAAERAAN